MKILDYLLINLYFVLIKTRLIYWKRFDTMYLFLAKVQKNLSAARKKDIDEDLTDYKSKRKEQSVSKPKPSPTLESSNCFMYKYYKQFKLDLAWANHL